MELIHKAEQWIITDEKTGRVVSIIGGEIIFVENRELARVFNSERDAVIFEENHIHPEDEFLEFDTMPERIF